MAHLNTDNTGSFQISAESSEGRNSAFRDTENDLSKLINSISVLNPSSWPKECLLTYGNEEVRYMCDIFHLDDVVARRGLQEYIDIVRTEGLQEPPERLMDLIKATKTIAVSTAECERGFSQMNILASSVRSSLTIKTLSILMFIKCVGPPPQEFCPLLYVRVRHALESKLLMKSMITTSCGKN